ncbi:MAG: hypothetical protein PHQ04_10260 [Opitutaceae bacterium]|nr:hypothetical protein [Opitutaceae bacterium]
MIGSPDTSRYQTLRWLATYAGYPTRRLPARAELLLLIAAGAAEEELLPDRNQSVRMSGQPFNAALRQYTTTRRHAHIKSDNRAKV